MKRRFFTLLALLSIATLGVTAPASATQASSLRYGTWEGQVERHGDHFDYVGLPCPIEEDICIQIIVHYRIVPLTSEAAKALPKVEGQRAQLEGALDSTSDGTHSGTLYVKKVIPVK
jgi:hypothetical protein